jgi:hypothetical protein
MSGELSRVSAKIETLRNAARRTSASTDTFKNFAADNISAISLAFIDTAESMPQLKKRRYSKMTAECKMSLRIRLRLQMEIRQEAWYSLPMVGSNSFSKFTLKPAVTAGGVRLGSSSSGPNRKLLLGVVGTAAAVVALVVIVLVARPNSKSDEPVSAGCRSDLDCSDGRFCAEGGCIVLLSSEHRGLWSDDIAAQKAKNSTWHPAVEVGERLPGSPVCPLPERAVPEPPVEKIQLLRVVDVVEVRKEIIVHHRYLKAKCAVWLDALRLEFTKARSVDPASVCGAPNTAGIRITDEQGGGTMIDLLLKNAAPTGKETVAGISFKQPLSAPGSGGERTLTVDLPAPNTPKDGARTLVAFPLGTDILLISGPLPTREKLLNGYVIYDFSHSNRLETAIFRYKISAAAAGSSVDITTESL